MALRLALILAFAPATLRAQSLESLRGPTLPPTSEALSAARQAAAATPGPDANGLPDIQDYSALQKERYPDGISREDIQRLVQAFVDQNYGKAFRTLGDPHDFDHGHFLFAKGDHKRPIAILYHTQEHADRFSVEDPGGKYDYIDRQARNWIQWVDGKKPAENANKYVRKTFPDTEGWAKNKEWHLKNYRTNYSVNLDLLDPEALGLDPDSQFPKYQAAKGADDLFAFLRVDCARLPQPLPKDKGLIEVFLPLQEGRRERERVCLVLGLQWGTPPKP